MLFFKRISDAWDEEHAQAVKDFGRDVTEEVESDYHRFKVPKGCHWSDIRKVTENVGIALQRVLDRIQEANPETLAAIFGDVAWGNKEKLPEPSLLNLIEAFNTLPLGPSRVGHDVLGNAYEYLLKMFADASGMKAGEFFTPRFVVRLLARILDPQPADTVYDPACGSGGMLIEAANEVIEAGGSVAQMRFYGQEVNLTTAAIARMNLFLHDIEDAKVLRGDTLRDPKFKDERGRLQRYDIVIANPPFSLKNWGADRWVNDPFGRSFCGTPPTGNADLAWVQHMVVVDESGNRTSWRRHAARCAVPGRGRSSHPSVPDRGRPTRCRHRSPAEPLLLHVHPGVPADLPGHEARRATTADRVRGRLQALRQGPEPEPDVP